MMYKTVQSPIIKPAGQSIGMWTLQNGIPIKTDDEDKNKSSKKQTQATTQATTQTKPKNTQSSSYTGSGNLGIGKAERG